MKISELIEALEYCRDKYGEINVVTYWEWDDHYLKQIIIE